MISGQIMYIVSRRGMDEQGVCSYCAITKMRVEALYYIEKRTAEVTDSIYDKKYILKKFTLIGFTSASEVQKHYTLTRDFDGHLLCLGCSNIVVLFFTASCQNTP